MRRRALLLCVGIPVVLGAVIGGLSSVLDVPVWIGILVAAPLAAAVVRRLGRGRATSRVRELYGPIVDPSFTPPDDDGPALSPLPERWTSACSTGDWSAARTLCDAGYTYEVLGTTVGRDRLIRTSRGFGKLFADVEYSVVAARRERGAPHVLWVHFRQRATERDGTPFALTWWERWVLTGDEQRIASGTLEAVTELV